MLGWLIATLNSFLDGELTTKFLLKAITAIGIAAAVFTFYYYDIKREKTKGKKDNFVRGYFIGTLIVVIATFIGSLFIVESPTDTRNRKLDNATLENFTSISNAIETYYLENEALPENLEVIKRPVKEKQNLRARAKKCLVEDAEHIARIVHVQHVT